MNIRCTMAVAALALGACASPAPTSTPAAPVAARSGATHELERYLTGYFTSAAQAAADKDYFNIELRVVPVWLQRSDGPWLYVEQADARTPDKPYRQRVYRLEARGAQYISHIYTLKGDPLRHAGEWKKPTPLAAAAPADLELRDGCAVVMTRTAQATYKGATLERACPSDLRGAKYASSIVEVSNSLLDSWDQGFDANGKQVWGALKGPYKFVKLAAKP
jgi:CpeT/CpcT family (DUF1001)